MATLIAILPIVLIYDSHFTTVTYRCDGKRALSLAANLPGNTHWGSIDIEGAVMSGSVTVEGMPINEPPQVFTTGTSVSMSYKDELYGPVDIVLNSGPSANCELRVTYRLKSDLSLLNPLW